MGMPDLGQKPCVNETFVSGEEKTFCFKELGFPELKNFEVLNRIVA
jgi:hypothetical protein